MHIYDYFTYIQPKIEPVSMIIAPEMDGNRSVDPRLNL